MVSIVYTPYMLLSTAHSSAPREKPGGQIRQAKPLGGGRMGCGQYLYILYSIVYYINGLQSIYFGDILIYTNKYIRRRDKWEISV